MRTYRILAGILSSELARYSRMEVSGILSGLRVVEGSAFVAAPLGGMTLAQLGAGPNAA